MVPMGKQEEEEARMVAFQSWIALQPEKERAYFCNHGRYVGFKRALAYKCSGCPEN